MTEKDARGWKARLFRWLDGRLPAPPQPGEELSPKDRSIVWLLRNRLPVRQGRPRGGGEGGYR